MGWTMLMLMMQPPPATAEDIDGVVQLAAAHSWVPMAAAVAWVLVRISKDDRAVRWFRVEIDPRWRAWASAILGLVFGVLHKLATGGTWGEAIVGGLVAGNGATVGHELIVESIRKGRDIGMAKEDAPPAPPPQPIISIKPPPAAGGTP